MVSLTRKQMWLTDLDESVHVYGGSERIATLLELGSTPWDDQTRTVREDTWDFIWHEGPYRSDRPSSVPAEGEGVDTLLDLWIFDDRHLGPSVEISTLPHWPWYSNQTPVEVAVTNASLDDIYCELDRMQADMATCLRNGYREYRLGGGTPVPFNVPWIGSPFYESLAIQPCRMQVARHTTNKLRFGTIAREIGLGERLFDTSPLSQQGLGNRIFASDAIIPVNVTVRR